MVFRHRRLFILSLCTVLAIFLAQALPIHARLVFVFIALGIFLLLLIAAFRVRGARLIALCFLCAALAFFSSYAYERPYEALSSFEGEHYTVTVRIKEVLHEDEDGSLTAEGELISIEKERLSLRVKVSADARFHAGDVIVASATVQRSEASETDKKAGRLAALTATDAVRVDTFSDLTLRVTRLRERIVARIEGALPEDEGAFLSVLLLGGQERLSDAIKSDMTRIGTVHMLSLSGLHIVLLSGAISFLLRRLHIGRRLRELLLVVFFAFFMVLTGFAASVLRACFMFFVASLSTVVRAERDSFTSLAAACAIICLAQPYAVTELSLWLSALATLGILLAAERMRKRKEDEPLSLGARLLRACVFSLVVTLAAMLATLPLTALFFGELPLLSPLANLLLSPLIQLALYLAALVALFGGAAPLRAVGHLLCTAIFHLTAYLARIPNTVLSIAEGAPLFITLAFFASVVLYFLFCPKERFLLRVPLFLFLVASVAVAGTLGGIRLVKGDSVTLTYRTDDEETADLFLLETKDEAYLFAAGAEDYLASGVQNELLSSLTELDAYVLLAYREESADMLFYTLANHTVHALYLPAPQDEAEGLLYEDIRAVAEKMCVPVFAVDKSETPLCDGIGVAFLERKGSLFGETERVIARITAGSTRILYFSGGALLSKHRDSTASAHLLLFGAFGGEPLLLYTQEDFYSTQRILCASPSHFPFAEKEGIAFGKTIRYTFARDASP